MVQYADNKKRAREQRTRISCLGALRGQINGLIDGWHSSGKGGSRDKKPKDELKPNEDKKPKDENGKRAARYERRVADAIVIGLENDIRTALALLAQVKNDIISERTSIARAKYLLLALLLAIGIVTFMMLFASVNFDGPYSFPPSLDATWTAISGGTIGAFFSIAIGLKGRTILIDLQGRDNGCDAVLRILIGAIAGGVLLCLLRSGLVSNTLFGVDRLDPANNSYSDQLVFVIGFVAGFFERLVPDLMDKTNLGTKEPGAPPAAAAVPTGTPTTQPPGGEIRDPVDGGNPDKLAVQPKRAVRAAPRVTG